jgi:hypothetical protein
MECNFGVVESTFFFKSNPFIKTIYEYMSPTKSSLPVPVCAHSLAVHRVALLPLLSPLSLPMLSSSPIGGTNTVLLLPLLPLLRMLP